MAAASENAELLGTEDYVTETRRCNSAYRVHHGEYKKFHSFLSCLFLFFFFTACFQGI